MHNHITRGAVRTGHRILGTLFIAACLMTATAGAAHAANRIEGYVTQSIGGRFDYARNVFLQVINTSTGRVVDTRYTDYAGHYTAFAPRGQYSIVARTAVAYGRNCCVNFSSDFGRVSGVNVLMVMAPR